MYVESLTSINTQYAVSRASAQVSAPAQASASSTASAPASASTASFQTAVLSASSRRPAKTADKAAEPGKKTESTDGDLSKQVKIAEESDDAMTLSITADDQLIDSQKNVNLDRLRKIMEQVAAALPHSEAKFGIHEKTNRITIKLVDKNTQEVIKEIPPEKSLDLMAKRMEIAGVLLDERL